MALTPIDRITHMLESDAPERRIAAAIVLGDLGAKGLKVVRALAANLADGNHTLQRHTLDALARIGAKRALDEILPLLASRDADVRASAINALVSVGEQIVPKLNARLSTAQHDERVALERVLAQLGGKEAFGALFAGLEAADEEEAAAAAVAMRSRARDADGRQRRSYLTQLEKVLQKQAKRKQPSAAVVRAAVKMLGYLEDERALPTLLKHAVSKKQPASVRQEALIAMRFAHEGRKPDAKLVSALVHHARCN